MDSFVLGVGQFRTTHGPLTNALSSTNFLYEILVPLKSIFQEEIDFLAPCARFPALAH